MTAGMIRDQRQPVQPGNPGRVAEKAVSDAIEQALTAYGQQRDAATERLFQMIYDAPVTQALTGVVAEGVRCGRGPARRQTTATSLRWPSSACAPAWPRAGCMRRCCGHWSGCACRAAAPTNAPSPPSADCVVGSGPKTLPLQEFKRIIHEQFLVVIVDEAQALATLPHLLPADRAKQAEAFGLIRSVTQATGAISEPEAERLAAVERIFLGEPDPAGADSKVRRLRPSGSATA